MKTLFVTVTGLSLALTAGAQRQTQPPITSAPPPLNPNVAPAAPQPGVATGATGGSAFPSTGGATGAPGGTATSTPFPVVMPPNAHPVYPEPLTPQDLVDFFRIVESYPSPEAAPAQGRPGGLGVTITGGGANQSGGGSGVTITGGSANQSGVANPPPAEPGGITNAPTGTNDTAPANAAGGSLTNAARPYP